MEEQTAAPSAAPRLEDNGMDVDAEKKSSRNVPANTNVQIEAMGNVSCAVTNNDEAVAIFQSDPSEDRVQQSLRFIVEVDDQQFPKGGKLVLCWVDPRGKLHHYYTFNENFMDHDEGTYTGDAFVAYHCSSNVADKPVTTSDLHKSERYTVLCSYRVKLALDNKYVHCVHYVNGENSGYIKVTAITKSDDEYRVVVRLPKKLCRLPPPDQSWEVRYEYLCPNLPNTKTWNKKTHTFYVWGDLDFDDYGASHFHNVPAHLRAVHPCFMNQIVPQVMIGNCLASNSSEYQPSWTAFDHWVIQAQYYWQVNKDDGRALCGEYVRVEPGDLIRTRICYNAEDGSIKVSIAVVGENGEEDSDKRSDIVIDRPFLHDPALFESWKDFFSKCIEAESHVEEEEKPAKAQRIGKEESPGLRGSPEAVVNKGALARPCLNVEYKGRVDIETLKAVCPFVVKEAAYPGLPPNYTSKWTPHLYCPRTGRVDVLEDTAKKNSLSIENAVTLG